MLFQRKYVLDLLSKTGKLGAKSCSIPMTPNVQITKEEDLFEDLERYRRLVGKLNRKETYLKTLRDTED